MNTVKEDIVEELDLIWGFETAAATTLALIRNELSGNVDRDAHEALWMLNMALDAHAEKLGAAIAARIQARHGQAD